MSKTGHHLEQLQGLSISTQCGLYIRETGLLDAIVWEAICRQRRVQEAANTGTGAPLRTCNHVGSERGLNMEPCQDACLESKGGATCGCDDLKQFLLRFSCETGRR
ncbi:hypothetical protein LIA77_04666 [Sarocladium implicatum]|nr:hypothetical protein LIA77_04666 [Sarocladium implicatum]